MTDINFATNRFISTGLTPVSYDAAGNITEDAKFRNLRFTYDAKGRQISSENLNTTNHATAVYDALGQRVATAIGPIHLKWAIITC